MSEQENITTPQNEDLTDESLSQEEELCLDRMAIAYKKIWISVGFCIVGWLMVCLGFGLMQYNVDVLKTPIIMILGFIVIAIPSVSALNKGGKITNLFNFEYITETTYADGHKTTTSDVSSTSIIKIVLFIFVIVFGIILTPIRVIAAFLGYKKCQKKLGIAKQEFKLDAIFPVVVGLAAFVLIIIITSILCGSIAKRNAKSDFTVQEMATYLTTVKEKLASDTYEYQLTDNEKSCVIKINHTAAGYTFVVSEKPQSETESEIALGTYTYLDGTWSTSDSTLTTYLESLTVENLLSIDDMISHSDKLNGQEEDTYIKIVYKYDDNRPTVEFDKETYKINRIIFIPRFENFDIKINY